MVQAPVVLFQRTTIWYHVVVDSVPAIAHSVVPVPLLYDLICKCPDEFPINQPQCLVETVVLRVSIYSEYPDVVYLTIISNVVDALENIVFVVPAVRTSEFPEVNS